MKKRIGKIIFLLILFLVGALVVKTSGIEKDKVLKRNDIKGYEKVTLFFANDTEMSWEGIKELHNAILNLYYQSTGEDKSDVLSHVYDTYMGITDMTFERKYEYYDSQVYVVGENYFFFHEDEFIYGRGFLSDLDNRDKVILSESLAFRIFGATNVCGQVLMCEGKPLVISGVVKDCDNLTDKMVGTDNLFAYVPYDSVLKAAKETQIVSYEILIQETVKGFSESILMDALEIDRYNEAAELEKNGVEYVDETDRFGVKGTLLCGKRLKEYVIQKRPFVYPRWENRTRMVEFVLFILTILGVIDVVLIMSSENADNPSGSSSVRPR